MRVLFLVSVASEFPVQLELAIYLQQTQKTEVIFLVNFVAHDLSLVCEQCHARGISAIFLFKPQPRQNLRYPKLQRRITYSRFFGRVVFALNLFRKCWTIQKSTETLFAKLGADILVVSNNKVNFFHPFIFRAAELQRLPVVFLPFGYETSASYRDKLGRTSTERSTLIRRLVFRAVFRQWDLPDVEHLPPSELIAHLFYMALLGAYPSKPLSPYGGNANIVLAESRFMRDIYKTLCSRHTRIEITGSPNGDIALRAFRNCGALRSALLSRYSKSSESSVVAISVPQYMPTYWPGPNGIKKYYDTLHLFFSDLHSVSIDVVFICSIHPRSGIDIVTAAAGYDNIVFVADSVYELIALCDFYIACESSTIRTAIALGKPTINYDIYNFCFDTFSSSYGVLGVTDHLKFREILQDFCSRGSRFQRASSSASQVSHLFAQSQLNACADITRILRLCAKNKVLIV